MPTAKRASDEIADAEESVKNAAKAAFENGQRSFNEAVDMAERSLGEAAKRVDKVLKEGVEALKSQTRGYTDVATEQFTEAQEYVLARVRERPVTATLTGLGVGLLLGLLLANRRR